MHTRCSSFISHKFSYTVAYFLVVTLRTTKMYISLDPLMICTSAGDISMYSLSGELQASCESNIAD
jgi:hypothetical protein